MIEISGCCDGCGKHVNISNINEFTRVPVFNDEGVDDYAFCHDCIFELAGIPGDVTRQIAELQKRHGR